MKILLISYYFSPYNSVGAVRPGKFARYLHERGHEVVVISSPQPFPKGLDLEIPRHQVYYPHWHSLTGIMQKFIPYLNQIPSSGYSSVNDNNKFKDWLRRQYRHLLFWPDAQGGWVKAAIKTGNELLTNKRFDFIYCSAPSFSGLRIAKALHEEFSVPWIAEYRDLWTDNHYFSSPFPKALIERFWERRILANASAIVTVSQPLAELLQEHKKPVWVIKNGFDSREFENLPAKSNEKIIELKIVFTGNIYKENNDLACLCKGIRQFIQNGGKLRLSLVGRNIAPLVGAAQHAGIDAHVDFQYLVPRQQALHLQKSADVLLLFLWQGEKQGISGTKLFEYSGAKNPILAIGSKFNDQAAIIEESGIGKVAENPEQVVTFLKQWQREKQEKGNTLFKQKQGFDFTREHQFRILETLLLESLEKQPS